MKTHEEALVDLAAVIAAIGRYATELRLAAHPSPADPRVREIEALARIAARILREDLR